MFLILTAILIVTLFHQFYWRRRNLPPGPTPLPLLGNLLAVGRNYPGFSVFDKWTKHYGPIYTLWIGIEPYVVIGTYETIKEAYVKDGDGYADKKKLGDIGEFYRGGKYGLIETNGQLWRDHRRFALHQMRDFGVGKDLMEMKILLEVDALVDDFAKNDGAEISNVKAFFDVAAGSIINQFLFGYRFEGEKLGEFRRLTGLIDRQTKELSNPLVLLQVTVPWIKHFLGKYSAWSIMAKYRDDIYNFFISQTEKHKKEIDFDSDVDKDYVEAYLKEQRKRESAGDMDTFCDKQLVNICLDLWFAGLETTSSTLTWTIAYAILYPETQEKLHEELDRVIGSDRQITMSDKNNLVYVSAFVNETQRFANIVPINLLHATTRDVVLNGVHLPKDTGVIAQISTVLYDDKVFPEPLTFRPERFIQDGKLKKVDELIPFSAGRRQCLGEGLARMELFLVVANIFNRFKFTESPEGKPSMVRGYDNTSKPMDFKCLVEKRKF